MGYSGRYHAASLAAVFLALAIGLLIGAEFGDDVVSGTAESLRKSLSGDLDEANAKIDDLEGELDQQIEFADTVYPALVTDTLRGRDIAVVALGDRPDTLRGDLLDALGPTGGKVTQVAVVREPPDRKALADLLPGRRSSRSARDREQQAAELAGRALVTGSSFYEDAREQLLSSFSGETGPVDGVVVVRDQPESAADSGATDEVEASLIAGLLAPGKPVVGVERTDADPSSIGFFDSQDLTTVDDIDLTAGGVALAYALRGAQGSFGTGDDAELIPPLLRGPGAANGQ